MTCFQFRRSVMASATLTAWGWCQIQIPDLTFQFCRRTTLQTTSPSRSRRSRLTTVWSRWFKKLFGLQLTDAQTRRAKRNLIEIKNVFQIMRKITSIYGLIDLSVTAKKFCSIGSCNVGVALWRPVWRRPKKIFKNVDQSLVASSYTRFVVDFKVYFSFLFTREERRCVELTSRSSVSTLKKRSYTHHCFQVWQADAAAVAVVVAVVAVVVVATTICSFIVVADDSGGDDDDEGSTHRCRSFRILDFFAKAHFTESRINVVI